MAFIKVDVGGIVADIYSAIALCDYSRVCRIIKRHLQSEAPFY